MTTTPSGARAIFPPVFATNRPERGETVAAEINRLLRGKRRSHRAPQPVAIATAYVNPAGIALLLDELERAPRVRLLLGAEPDRATARPAKAGLSLEELHQTLRMHEAWLAAERDLTGFSREADGAARRLVEWLRSNDAGDGHGVEVRRYEDGFLHGKAFLVEHEFEPAVLAGSSNLTHAGLTTNAELNLGYPSGHHTHLVQDWFGHFWERSAPFPLADLYASRWDPHSPWIVFLRMLWEFYGHDLEADDRAALAQELSLTAFQRDGVSRALRLLKANGGVLVADEVGLGKTYIAAEMIRKATEEHRQRVLVLAPAALKESMWEPFLNGHGFSRRVRCMSYDELRLAWRRDEEDTRRKLDDYALVIVDEAHNLRNPRAQRTETVAALVGGEHPKQVVLLTATPVNNSLGDLHALVSLFIRNDAFFAHAGIPVDSRLRRGGRAHGPGVAVARTHVRSARPHDRPQNAELRQGALPGRPLRRSGRRGSDDLLPHARPAPARLRARRGGRSAARRRHPRAGLPGRARGGKVGRIGEDRSASR